MDLSIVIVSWNTRDILRNCLRSVFYQTQGIRSEVIVVDNASSDGSAEMVKTEFSQVALIENHDNRGFAVANNQGMALSCGRYLLLLNSDTVVLDDAISKIVAFADNHPEAAVVGCRVLNPDKTLQPTCFMFPSLLNLVLAATHLYKLFPRNKFFGRERMTWWDRSDTREVDVVTGCCMLVRREAIERVGIMDDAFFMYGEETDWCYRLKFAGWKVMFTPGAQIIHFGKASSSRIKSTMRLQLSGSILIYFKKHKGWIQYIFASFLTAIFFLIRIPYWLGIAIFSKKDRYPALITVRTYSVGFFLSFAGYRYLCCKQTSSLHKDIKGAVW
ncbi:MAG: glycosyltransferase family 2 protein [Planctomycetota bacterium]